MKLLLTSLKISCIMRLRSKKGVERMQSKLASIRRYNNISQREMAEVLNISTSSYSLKELGKNQFTATEMFVIASKFNMRLDQIFLPPDFIKYEVEGEDQFATTKSRGNS